MKNKKDVVNERQNEISSRKNIYLASVINDDINEAKLRFEDGKSRYEDDRKSYKSTLIAGVSSLAIAYAATSYLLWKRKKKSNPKPIYKAQNPFALQNFSIDTELANFGGNSIHQLTFRLTF